MSLFTRHTWKPSSAGFKYLVGLFVVVVVNSPSVFSQSYSSPMSMNMLLQLIQNGGNAIGDSDGFSSHGGVFLNVNVDDKLYADNNNLPTLMFDEAYVPGDFLNTTELIRRRGFFSEVYRVVTPDGYVLQLTRIVTGIVPKEEYVPVLFMHGILACSDQWLMRGRGKDLPFILAEHGFDVWLGDQRGNSNSRSHVEYGTKDPRYWNFSLDESGGLDIPAFMDTIRDRTGVNSLSYIGHSYGTTVFLAMSSMRPDYAQRVKLAVLLAPVAFSPRPSKSTVLNLLLRNLNHIVEFVNKNKIYEFLPRSKSLIRLVQQFCRTLQGLCISLYGDVYGENASNMNKSMTGYYYSSIPSGTSSKTMIHLSKIFTSGRFQNYDYGVKENLERYGNPSPPLYAINKISTPIALFFGNNDGFLNRKTVQTLGKYLPNLVMLYEVPDRKFTHIDFMFGMNAKVLVHDKVLNLLQSYTKR